MKLYVLPVIFALTAGCLGEPTEGGVTSTSSGVTGSISGSSTSSSPTVPPALLPPTNLDLSGCRGLGFTADVKRELFAPSFPPGWEPGENQVIMAIDHYIHRCERVAFGPFERPLTFALESVNSFSPAQHCFEGDFTFGWLLQSFWVEDVDVYAYARDILGLPVRLVVFNETVETIQGARAIRWALNTGGSAGDVSFYDVPGQTFQGPQPDRRWFWYNGKGISYMDWHADYKDDVQTVRAAHGTLPPPFLYGQSDIPDQFIARANLFEQGSVHAPIQRFEDLECKRPM